MSPDWFRRLSVIVEIWMSAMDAASEGTQGQSWRGIVGLVEMDLLLLSLLVGEEDQRMESFDRSGRSVVQKRY